jgi:hypothetical protein
MAGRPISPQAAIGLGIMALRARQFPIDHLLGRFVPLPENARCRRIVAFEAESGERDSAFETGFGWLLAAPDSLKDVL